MEVGTFSSRHHRGSNTNLPALHRRHPAALPVFPLCTITRTPHLLFARIREASLLRHDLGAEVTSKQDYNTFIARWITQETRAHGSRSPTLVVPFLWA